MRRSSLSRSLVLMAGLAFAGCSDDGGGASTGTGGDGGGIGRVDSSALVTVITADDAKVLDPHATSDGGNVKVIFQIYETLVWIDHHTVDKLVPGLAESWEVAQDARSIAFKLREGVTFHDGEPFDAAAAKLSLDRLRKADSTFLLPSAPYAPEFSHVTAIEADGHTLTVRLDAPVARVALRNMAMFCAAVVSPKVLNATKGMEADAATQHVTQNATGTGPFKLDSFDPAAKITRLVANEDYRLGAPQVKTLIFQPVSDESTRTEYLTKSDGYFMVDDVPRQHWDTVEKSASMELHDWWALNVCYLGMNAVHENTKDLRVRQAIALAVDREAVIEHYEGTARPTFSMVAQPMGEYDPEYRAPGWVPDEKARLDAAKKLVKEAGAENGVVTIYYPLQPRPYLPRPQDIADTVRQNLKLIGLDARIQGEDKNKLFPGVPTGQYELILIGWMTDNGDPDNFYSPLTDGADGKPSENNTSRLFHPGVHAKIVAAQQINDSSKRVKAYREIEAMLQEKVAGYVPLVNTKQAVAYSSSMEGVVVDPVGHYRFDKTVLKK